MGVEFGGWNYRVVKFDEEPACYGIYEVFYSQGQPTSRHEKPKFVFDGADGFDWVVAKMREGLSKPVLTLELDETQEVLAKKQDTLQDIANDVRAISPDLAARIDAFTTRNT